MHRIFQTFIDGLAEGSDEPAFSNAMSRAASALDLSCFAYLCLPHRTNDKARLISTYPQPWTAHYLKSHYERLDPVILHSRAWAEHSGDGIFFRAHSRCGRGHWHAQ